MRSGQPQGFDPPLGGFRRGASGRSGAFLGFPAALLPVQLGALFRGRLGGAGRPGAAAVRGGAMGRSGTAGAERRGGEAAGPFCRLPGSGAFLRRAAHLLWCFGLFFGRGRAFFAFLPGDRRVGGRRTAQNGAERRGRTTGAAVAGGAWGRPARQRRPAQPLFQEVWCGV